MGTADGTGGEHRWWPTAAGRVGLRCFCVILSRSLDAKGRRNVGGLLDKDMIFMLSLNFFFFYKVGRLEHIET